MDTGTAGVALNELAAGLDPGMNHWRMRLLYDPATTPSSGASRWFTTPWNGWQEGDVRLAAGVGGRVWDDLDADGIQDPTEPGLESAAVHLLDASGSILESTTTDTSGSYSFGVDERFDVRLWFPAVSGSVLSPGDQGADDLLDSDPDPATGMTELLTITFAEDLTRWSAGMTSTPPCVAPDEPIFIPGARPSVPDNFIILDFQDSNLPSSVTGYNIYRSSLASLPRDSWPLVAGDVIDMDEATSDKQWIDTSGDVSPTGAWFYDVAAYNNGCSAEGPR